MGLCFIEHVILCTVVPGHESDFSLSELDIFSTSESMYSIVKRKSLSCTSNDILSRGFIFPTKQFSVPQASLRHFEKKNRV